MVLLDTHAWAWSIIKPALLSERAHAAIAQGSLLAPLTSEICLEAGLTDWPNRDPFDRLLGATARCMGVPLVTRDPVFAEAGVACIW